MRIKRNDLHMQEILQGSSAAFILKVVAAALSFILNVLIARSLGAQGAGQFYLSLTCMTIATVVGQFGLGDTLVRFIGANAPEKNWKAVNGIYQKSIQMGVITSIISALILFSSAELIARNIFSKPEVAPLIRLLSIAVIPFTLFKLHAFALQGLKRITASISVLSVFLPAITIAGILSLQQDIQVRDVIVSYVVAAIFTLAFGVIFWIKSNPEKKSVDGDFPTQEIFKSSMPLFWMTVLNLAIMWSSTFFLGIWSTNEEIGIFNIANRTAALTSFALMAVNSIAAPKFASLYNKGEFEVLGATTRKSTLLITIFASPALIAFIFFPSWILSLFGPQFKEGALLLSILALGQFINAITGSVSYLLIMSGHEKQLRNIVGFCAALCIILNIFLIPAYGVIGAAMAVAITQAAKNIIASAIVWFRLKIITIPLLHKIAVTKDNAW